MDPEAYTRAIWSKILSPFRALWIILSPRFVRATALGAVRRLLKSPFPNPADPILQTADPTAKGARTPTH